MPVSDSQPVSVGNLKEVVNGLTGGGGSLLAGDVLFDGNSSNAQLSHDVSGYTLVAVCASYNGSTQSAVMVPAYQNSADMAFGGTIGSVVITGTSASSVFGVTVRRVVGIK